MISLPTSVSKVPYTTLSSPFLHRHWLILSETGARAYYLRQVLHDFPDA
jgi:hypothetical protein